ncbi:MAG: hypothetical protein AAB532_02245 [Patescibacteria group bacterium]
MYKIIVLLIIGAVILSGAYLFLTKNSKFVAKTVLQETPSVKKTSSKVDYSASFAIFTNGTFRIFTAPMYHNLSSDVYIKADNPNTVYVKRSDITWNDFFKTLPFALTKECLTTGTKQTFCTDTNGRLKFYVNGNEDFNALDKYIENGDKLLVTYGKENELQIQKQLQQVPSIK